MMKQLSKKNVEKVTNETVIALFVIFARRDEKNHWILSRISGLRTQIRKQDLRVRNSAANYSSNTYRVRSCVPCKL